MEWTKEEYDRLVQSLTPPSPLGKDLLWAFFVGGAICTLGQWLSNWYQSLGLETDAAGTAVSVTLIGAAALLTGLGVFDKLAKHAGAGTLVPITGFANAIAAPAVEFRSESLLQGTCAKMFVIAGPVIVCGVSSSVVYGLILCLLARF